MYGHWINITQPNEAHLPMCNYCKSRGHAIFACPRIAEKTCAICKQKGHDQLYCPNFESEEQYRQIVHTIQNKNQNIEKHENEKPQNTVGTSQQKENIQPLPTENRFQQLSDSEEDEYTNKQPPSDPSLASFLTVCKKKSKRKSVIAIKRKMEDTKKKKTCKAKPNNDIQEQEQQQQVAKKNGPRTIEPGLREETAECFNNTPTESVAD